MARIITRQDQQFVQLPPPSDQPFTITHTAQTFNRYDVYISEEIVEPSKYVDLFHILQTATQNDVITIHLNSPGGNVDTGYQIIAFMQDSQAHIITALYGTSCSMATGIFLSGDEFIVSPFSRMMIHNFSAGGYGKGHELKSMVQSTAEWVDEASKKIYIPFLTESEYNEVVKGCDMWLLAPEINERLQRVVEYRNQQQQEYEDEQLDNLRTQLDNLSGQNEQAEPAEPVSKSAKRKTVSSDT